MSRSRHDRFTLLELLVVVAILTILAGLFVPALNKARARALSLSCGHNLKRLGMAACMYSEDSDGYIAPTYYGLEGDEAIEAYGTWDLKYGAYMGYALDGNGRPAGSWPGFRCPVDSPGNPEFVARHHRRSYGIVEGFVNTASPAQQTSYYNFPGQIYFLGEIDFAGNTESVAYLVAYGPANRVGVTGDGQSMAVKNSRCFGANHDNRAWILYLDCHAALKRNWSFRHSLANYSPNTNDSLKFADNLMQE